jgi:hypothetical protein
MNLQGLPYRTENKTAVNIIKKQSFSNHALTLSTDNLKTHIGITSLLLLSQHAFNFLTC